MATNPLQQFYRQPKIYIKLPSLGVYNPPGSLTGDADNMPVYGMTGMDEIVAKTPDALLTGESTAKVIASCCPNIKDPWQLSSIDISTVMAAIRIATSGNIMPIEHTCSNCGTVNDYEVDLNSIIENFKNKKFKTDISLEGLTLKLQPLNYKLANELSLRNFRITQQLNQVQGMEDNDQRQEVINRLFKELGDLQKDIFLFGVESVQTQDTVVTDRNHIKEWLENCDKVVFDKIKERNEENLVEWAIPEFPVECDHCQTKVTLTVDMDQSNFFVAA